MQRLEAAPKRAVHQRLDLGLCGPILRPSLTGREKLFCYSPKNVAQCSSPQRRANNSGWPVADTTYRPLQTKSISLQTPCSSWPGLELLGAESTTYGHQPWQGSGIALPVADSASMPLAEVPNCYLCQLVHTGLDFQEENDHVDVLVGEGATGVPLLVGAASAPWRPSHASHEGFPSTLKFGGCAPPQMCTEM